MKIFKYATIVYILFISVCAHAQVAIIANKSVPDNSIEMGKVNAIYLLRDKKWSNGSNINPVTLKTECKTTEEFFGAIGRTSMEMKKYWMKVQLTGDAQPPDGAGSEDELIAKVASTPGAIGFVNASKVNSKIKVLLTFKVD